MGKRRSESELKSGVRSAVKPNSNSEPKIKSRFKNKSKHGINPDSRSFRRAYREDYQSENVAPGITEHIGKTLTVLIKNYKIFLPFTIIVVLCGLFSIGTNGIAGQISSGIFAFVIGVMIWMVTIFSLRQILVGNKITLRGAMYNAFTALVPTVIIAAIIAIECLPIVLLIMLSSAAIETNFLAMPFYAMLFFLFALLMIMLSGYLLTTTVITLIAVTAPGLYPIKTMMASFDLMRGQRAKFLMRLIILVLFLGIVDAIIVVPFRAIGASDAVIAITEMIIACIDGIFATTYLYLYYQWVIR